MARINPLRMEDALSHFPYPGNREAMREYARRSGADEDIVRALGQIPSGVYHSSAEVMRVVANDTDSEVP